jgi:hypothetical protein
MNVGVAELGLIGPETLTILLVVVVVALLLLVSEPLVAAAADARCAAGPSEATAS